ncbi:MAG: alpha/beta hydrolase [Sphingomonadales bacterium]|nr:MAG: alpha/beta hydrolase [Sphingomonadales bacterium]
MMRFDDGFFWSRDGIRLHYRDYAGPADRPVLVCLPGLTRNCRDFEGVAERLAGQWRLVCPDMRGRGDSGYAPDPLSYTPLVYMQDIEAMVAALSLERIVFLGTSLGGLLTMFLAGPLKDRIAGAMLNDIGPTLEAVGLQRIAGYVGKIGPWPTWVHLARHLAATGADVFPKFDLTQWLVFAKRVACVQPSGRIVLDYDPRIAEPFRMPNGAAGVADLWPAFEALAGVPSLSLRGTLSDLLTAETQAEMARRNPDMAIVTVPDVGHAPTLDEPESIAAIDALLARVLAARAAAA